MGDHRDTHDSEALALREGAAQGMTLIDTAEMYGNGRSERLIGDALAGHLLDAPDAEPLDRDQLHIVSKVLPNHAGEPDIFYSCDDSLEALGTDHLDLYLLHWRGGVPLRETVRCMEELVEEGKIGAWGARGGGQDRRVERLELRHRRHGGALAHPGGSALPGLSRGSSDA